MRVREVGEAVQAHRGLAAARAALDDDDAGAVGRDELELAWIDERRDLGQVPIERLVSAARSAGVPAAASASSS